MKSKKNNQPYAELFLRIFEALGYQHAGKKLLRQELLRYFPYLGEHTIPILFDSNPLYPDADRLIKNVQSLLKKSKFLKVQLTPSISINTFFTLFQYIARIGIDDFIKDEDLRNVITKASEIFEAQWKNAINQLTTDMCCALITNSDFRKVLFEFDYEAKRTVKFGCSFRVIVRSVAPEVREFELDGVIRKTYRVGRCGKGSEVKWYSYFFQGREYPIYIQNHAINALEKRIDTSKTTLLLFHLAISLEKPELRFYEGKYLLTYRINNKIKVGYFVCTFISGCIVLRTFLFITYDGTPEGDLVTVKLELDRQSKTYMGLEKHSTYQIALENEDLKAYLPSISPAPVVEFQK